jgi:hypothetical protein
LKSNNFKINSLEEVMKKMFGRIASTAAVMLALGMLASGVAVAKNDTPKAPKAPKEAKAPNAKKEAICHVKGNGTYKMISVAKSAIPAHKAHGDAYPGDIVLGLYVVEDDCSLTETARVDSQALTLQPGGCAVVFCDGDNIAIGGGYEPTTDPELPSEIASGDTSTCAAFGTGTASGFVVTNPVTAIEPQDLTTVYVLCTPPPQVPVP